MAHYKKDGSLDMRYSSSRAAVAASSSASYSSRGGGSTGGYGSSSYYGDSSYFGSSNSYGRSSSGGNSLHYKKDGTLDMRYSSSKAAVATANSPFGNSAGYSTHGYVQSVAPPAAPASQALHYKKDGTLDMRYKSSQEVVAKQMQQLDIASSSTATQKRAKAATSQRKSAMGIPSHVPVTKSGFPDLRTRAAKDWIQAEAKTWNDATPLPRWIPRLKDGSPDTTKSATRTFFSGAPSPPPPRRDEYYAERLMDEMFRRLVELERKQTIARLPAPERLQNTAAMRATLERIHESDSAADRSLSSSVRQLDYARDLVVNETDAPLGRGSFGVVLRGTWEGKSVAIKQLHAAQLSKRDRKMFTNETLVLGVLGKHPNIVRLFGYTLTPPALVMEFVPRGSLSYVLHYCKDPQVEATMTDGRIKLNLLLGIAYGMTQLHACGVTHGDLKPQNVLVSEDYQAKIADFGLATLRAKTSSTTSSHVLVASGSAGQRGDIDRHGAGNEDDVDQEGAACGTAAYMAPELLNPLEVTNEKTDVYSFGVLMNELLHEEEPYYESLRQFAGKGPFAAVLAAMSGQRPVVKDEKVTPELKRLIERCWSERASRRPTFDEIGKKLAACKGVPNSCS